MKRIDESDTPETILSVTHGYFLQYVTYYFLRSNDKLTLKNNSDIMLKLMPNAGFLKIGIERRPPAGQPRTLEVLAEHVNCHLKPLEKDDTIHTYTQTAPEAKPFLGCMHH